MIVTFIDVSFTKTYLVNFWAYIELVKECKEIYAIFFIQNDSLTNFNHYNLEIQANPNLKIQHWSSFDLNDLERPNWEFKKKYHGIIPFLP